MPENLLCYRDTRPESDLFNKAEQELNGAEIGAEVQNVEHPNAYLPAASCDASGSHGSGYVWWLRC
nr:hypothetical protein [Pantoea dispersa]